MKISTKKVRYDEIKVGDFILTKLEGSDIKIAAPQLVTNICRYAGNAYKICFGEDYGTVGWFDRELDLIIENI